MHWYNVQLIMKTWVIFITTFKCSALFMHTVLLRFLMGSVLLIFLVFCVVFFFALFICVLFLLCPMLQISLDCPFLIRYLRLYCNDNCVGFLLHLFIYYLIGNKLVVVSEAHFLFPNTTDYIDLFRFCWSLVRCLHKAMFGSSLPPVVCRRSPVLFTWFVFVCV